MAEFFTVCVSLLITLLTLSFFYVRRCYGYWERKKIPFLTPKFPLGNIKDYVPRGIGLGHISYDWYHAFKKQGSPRFGGVYIGLDPALVVMEPEDVKSIIIKDFDHFIDRGIYMSEKVPITVSIFAQTGNEWKTIRQKLSVLFTSAKMKQFFGLMTKCCDQAVPIFEDASQKNTDLDIREILACYTTDVIGNVCYGLECNSFKDPNAPFRVMGRKLFEEFSWIDQIRLCLTVYYPKFSRKVGITNIQTEVADFFIENITKTVEYREKNNVHRQDLMELLIQMKNVDKSLSMNELISQTFLFFSAGYETSSTTMTFAFYHLGKNQDVQEKLRQEIFTVLGNHDNQLTYDGLNEMKYLHQVLEETMRMWPVLQTLPRVCEKNYHFEKSNLTVEAGTRIIIPSLGMHRDSKYYDDPLTWNPERFNPDCDPRKGKQYVPFFGFGDGPRNCIGARFGAMQFKIGLVTVLKDFRVHVSPKTIEPLEIDEDNFVIKSTNKIYLNLEKL